MLKLAMISIVALPMFAMSAHAQSIGEICYGTNPASGCANAQEPQPRPNPIEESLQHFVVSQVDPVPMPNPMTGPVQTFHSIPSFIRLAPSTTINNSRGKAVPRGRARSL